MHTFRRLRLIFLPEGEGEGREGGEGGEGEGREGEEGEEGGDPCSTSLAAVVFFFCFDFCFFPFLFEPKCFSLSLARC